MRSLQISRLLLVGVAPALGCVSGAYEEGSVLRSETHGAAANGGSAGAHPSPGATGGVIVHAGGGHGPKSGAAGSNAAGEAGAGGASTLLPALGVKLTLVEANQGTAVALSTENLAERTQRNAVLIAGRPALIRAHFEIEPGFVPRELRAVLSLAHGAVTETRSSSKRVLKSSETDILESTFNFLLSASEVTEDLKLSIELQEMIPDATGSELAVRFPKLGSATFGAKAGRMELHVVIVPAKTAQGVPVSTPARRTRIEQHLFDLYPVQKVNVTWAEAASPVDPKDRLTSYELLRDMCQRDRAAPNVLYHLLIARADSEFGFRGISAGANSATLACSAVAITVLENAPGEDVAYIDGTETPNGGNPNTIAHELAHNHGRKHVACGNVANPDLRFPYEEGFLGAQGYSLKENALKPTKQFRELMGYCSPRWISDWMWNQLEKDVRTLTAFSGADIASGGARLLSGLVTKKGEASWAIVRGRRNVTADELVHSGTATLRFPNRQETVAFSRLVSGDPDVDEIFITLPAGPLPSAIELASRGVRHTIRTADVKNYARY
jgi:hypothetical protein